jgi:small GTP-binding protein
MQKSKPELNLVYMKILVLGNSGVGKTSLLRLYRDNEVPRNISSTMGLDVVTVDETLKDNMKVRFLIFDTAGQEKYRSMAQSNYKNAKGILMIYAVNDINSFNDVKRWIKDVGDHNSNVSWILVGNKADIDQRTVSFAEGENLAKQHGFNFFETSIYDDKRPNHSLRINDIVKRLGELIIARENDMKMLESGGQKLETGKGPAQPGRCGKC